MPRPVSPVPEVEPTAKPTKPGATRVRRGQDKRDLILQAAIKVFARAGVHGARVSDIAKEAGIAYGLVYHYFKNKDEILVTIFEEQWLGFLAAVRDIGNNGQPLRDRLVSIAALILNAYRLRPDWVKVLVFEIQRSARFAQPGQVQAMRRLFDEFEDLFERAQVDGEMRTDIRPAVSATMFIGALEIVITSLVLETAALPADETEERAYYLAFANETVEIFLNGCARGGSTR